MAALIHQVDPILNARKLLLKAHDARQQQHRRDLVVKDDVDDSWLILRDQEGSLCQETVQHVQLIVEKVGLRRLDLLAVELLKAKGFRANKDSLEALDARPQHSRVPR